jgi:transcriptional regulator with XRE-family HTH domain
MSLFSKNLRFLRRKGSYKQEEIAALFNKKPNTVGNWENEKSEPSLSELVRLGAYFNVSTQELLHTDIEKDSHKEGQGAGEGQEVKEDQTAKEGLGVKEGKAATVTNITEQKVRTYPLADPVISMAQEAGPDAFWLVLHELRALNTKVDLLVSSLDPSAFKRNSDKSNH